MSRFLHRLVQGHLAHCMTTAHSAVRQPSAALLGVGKPSAVFHAFEELLEIAQCQLVKGDISYTGDQVVIDQIFIVLLCCLYAVFGLESF